MITLVFKACMDGFSAILPIIFSHHAIAWWLKIMGRIAENPSMQALKTNVIIYLLLKFYVEIVK